MFLGQKRSLRSTGGVWKEESTMQRWDALLDIVDKLSLENTMHYILKYM